MTYRYPTRTGTPSYRTPALTAEEQRRRLLQQETQIAPSAAPQPLDVKSALDPSAYTSALGSNRPTQMGSAQVAPAPAQQGASPTQVARAAIAAAPASPAAQAQRSVNIPVQPGRALPTATRTAINEFANLPLPEVKSDAWIGNTSSPQAKDTRGPSTHPVATTQSNQHDTERLASQAPVITPGYDPARIMFLNRQASSEMAGDLLKETVNATKPYVNGLRDAQDRFAQAVGAGGQVIPTRTGATAAEIAQGSAQQYSGPHSFMDMQGVDMDALASAAAEAQRQVALGQSTPGLQYLLAERYGEGTRFDAALARSMSTRRYGELQDDYGNATQVLNNRLIDSNLLANVAAQGVYGNALDWYSQQPPASSPPTTGGGTPAPPSPPPTGGGTTPPPAGGGTATPPPAPGSGTGTPSLPTGPVQWQSAVRTRDGQVILPPLTGKMEQHAAATRINGTSLLASLMYTGYLNASRLADYKAAGVDLIVNVGAPISAGASGIGLMNIEADGLAGAYRAADAAVAAMLQGKRVLTNGTFTNALIMVRLGWSPQAAMQYLASRGVAVNTSLRNALLNDPYGQAVGVPSPYTGGPQGPILGGFYGDAGHYNAPGTTTTGGNVVLPGPGGTGGGTIQRDAQGRVILPSLSDKPTAQQAAPLLRNVSATGPATFISNNLLQSGLPQNAAALRQAGVDVVVSVTGSSLPSNFGAPGLTVVRMGFNDTPNPTQQDLLMAYRAADAVAKLLLEGKRVLVNCSAGYNRSSLVNALALVRLGWTPQAAIAQVTNARVADGINGVFGNTTFKNLVLNDPLGHNVQGYTPASLFPQGGTGTGTPAPLPGGSPAPSPAPSGGGALPAGYVRNTSFAANAVSPGGYMVRPSYTWYGGRTGTTIPAGMTQVYSSAGSFRIPSLVPAPTADGWKPVLMDSASAKYQSGITTESVNGIPMYKFSVPKDGDPMNLGSHAPRSEFDSVDPETQRGGSTPYTGRLITPNTGQQYYKWTMNIPTNFTENLRWATVMQYHVINNANVGPDNLNMGGVAIHGGYLDFSNPSDNYNNSRNFRIPLSQIKGQNIDIAMDVNWSSGSDGHIQWYLNGQPVGPMYRGPTATLPIYLKQGLYTDYATHPGGNLTIYESPMMVYDGGGRPSNFGRYTGTTAQSAQSFVAPATQQRTAIAPTVPQQGAIPLPTIGPAPQQQSVVAASQTPAPSIPPPPPLGSSGSMYDPNDPYRWMYS